MANQLLERARMNPHILFVDDEAPIRELLSLYFRKKGFDVTTAVSAEEGRELAAKVPFDLAIVDVDIAGENGLDLLKHFRTNYPRAPVVIFSGMAGGALEQQAIDAGAVAFVAKSQSLSALFEAVSPHVPDSRR
jgi:DNA-binding NtrC family response regulator